MPAVWKRILSASLMIPAVLLLIFKGSPAVFAVAIGLLVILALHEFYILASCPLATAGRIAGLALGSAIVLLPPTGWISPLDVLLFGSVLLGGIGLVDCREIETSTRAWIHSVFGLIYVALPLSLLYPLRFEALGQSGEYRILFLLIPQWLQDTAAFFIGSRWGRHRMAPAISPKKSWEGAVAGLAAAVLGGLLFHFFVLQGSEFGRVLVYSLVLGATGQISDLGESLFKRAVCAKDSSQIIPGHGGVLDRIDGLLFAAPVYWLLLRYWPL